MFTKSGKSCVFISKQERYKNLNFSNNNSNFNNCNISKGFNNNNNIDASCSSSFISKYLDDNESDVLKLTNSNCKHLKSLIDISALSNKFNGYHYFFKTVFHHENISIVSKSGFTPMLTPCQTATRTNNLKEMFEVTNNNTNFSNFNSRNNTEEESNYDLKKLKNNRLNNVLFSENPSNDLNFSKQRSFSNLSFISPKIESYSINNSSFLKSNLNNKLFGSNNQKPYSLSFGKKFSKESSNSKLFINNFMLIKYITL